MNQEIQDPQVSRDLKVIKEIRDIEVLEENLAILLMVLQVYLEKWVFLEREEKKVEQDQTVYRVIQGLKVILEDDVMSVGLAHRVLKVTMVRKVFVESLEKEALQDQLDYQAKEAWMGLTVYQEHLAHQ